MTIYRCKSCGQLVEPEKNKICPACKAELQNNMVREIVTGRGNSSHRRRNGVSKLLIRYLVGLVFLALFFGVFLPKYFDKQSKNVGAKQQKSISTNTNTGTGTNVQTNTGSGSISNNKTETKEVLEPGKPEQVYFVKGADIAFNESIKKKLAAGDADIMKFTIKEYRNGDVWINTDKVTFTPLEKIVIESKEYWLLIPATSTESQKGNFPSAYKEDSSSSEAIFSQNYASKRPNVTAFFKQALMDGTEMEAVVITKWTDDDLCLQNVVFHYEFAEFKTIQTADGIVYETEDGNRYADYIQIPHSIVFDQEKSANATVLKSELVLD